MHLNIFKHKETGELLQLIKVQDNNINTFVLIDNMGYPIYKERSWDTNNVQEQIRLIEGFDKLESI